MAKKLKLLNVKEARAKVVELQYKLHDRDLEVNNLDNALKSMTGARDNCKTMYEFNVSIAKEKEEKVQALKTIIKMQNATIEDLKNSKVQDSRQLTAYRNETAGQLVSRAVSKVCKSVSDALVNLRARLGFKKL